MNKMIKELIVYATAKLIEDEKINDRKKERLLSTAAVVLKDKTG